MNIAHARAFARYYANKYHAHTREAELAVAAIRASLHSKQQQFTDNWIDTIIAGLCGRRAGKSEAIGGKLCQGAMLTPDAYSCYIGLTGKGAKQLMWPVLTRLNNRFSLRARPNVQEGSFTFPNGHKIFLGGAETKGEIEKYRSYKYKLAALDECGSMGPWIKELIKDILLPACIDVRGQIALIGTPGPVCDGYFWEATDDRADHDESVPTYRWTVLDNPFVPGAQAWLAETKEKQGWDDNHPTYLREWMGVWVPDWNKLCFPRFDKVKNNWDGVLPNLHGQGKWEHVLAIDLGYDDGTSFTDIIDSTACDTAYVKSSYKEVHMELSAVFERARTFCANNRVRRIVVDASGGGGKNIVADWQKRFNVPLHAPHKDKNAKRNHIALVNNAFSDRKLLVNVEECADLVHEMATVCWDDKRKKPDPRYPNDCTDSLEYGFMESYHYAGSPPTPPKSTLTNEERYAREAEEHEAREVKKHRKAERDARRRAAIY